MEKFGFGIRDKHLGSATLVKNHVLKWLKDILYFDLRSMTKISYAAVFVVPGGPSLGTVEGGYRIELTLCVFSFQYPDIPAEAPGKGAGKPLHLGREV